MPDLPLARLDVSQSKFWWLSPAARLLVARVFSKRYGECLILTFDLLAVGKAHKNGQLEVLRPPYYRFEMWQIANKPEVTECKCAEFYDPEVQGPWRLRQSERHHPFCIYDRPSTRVYAEFVRPLPLYSLPERKEDLDRATEKKIREHTNAVQKEIAKETLKQRPDAWNRARDELEGHAEIRTR